MTNPTEIQPGGVFIKYRNIGLVGDYTHPPPSTRTRRPPAPLSEIPAGRARPARHPAHRPAHRPAHPGRSPGGAGGRDRAERAARPRRG
eukprot:1181668-Prorocentrum_minimum.AAC.2